MDLFELLGKVTIDNADANKALADTSAQGEKTQSKLASAFGKVGQGAAIVGKTVMTGLAAGGAAMGALTIEALKMSGDLEQNMGGSEQVFAEYAGKMQDTAKTAFSNMGLSTNDFLATANKMGALFQGAGFSIEESSELSANAMQRAADVASIMGLDTSSAMEAIAGAAKGNFTMMDNLGVAMNETALAAYALEKGYEKTYDQMSQQEKIGVAMEMFMDKTAYAAGNYAKENQTLAGSLGTAKSALTNFLDGSGDVDSLVNALSNAANVIVDNVKTIAPRLINGIADLVNQILPILPPLIQEILPVIIEGAVNLVNGLVAAVPMLLDVIMGALPALLDGVIQILDAVISALPQLVESIISALPSLIPQLVNGLVSLIVLLCTMLPQIIQPIIDYLPEIIIALVDALLQNLPILLMGVLQLIMGLVAALPDLLVALWDALQGVFTSLVTNMGVWFQPVTDWFSSVWDGFIGIVSGAWDGIKNAVNIAIQFIASLLNAAFQIITLPFRFIWENCKDTIMTVWNTIKDAVSKAINAVKNTITTVFNAVKNFITPIWNGIKNTITSVWDGIKNTTSNVINTIKNTVSNVFNGIKNTISNIWNGIKTVTTNVWNGIKDAMSKPIEKARDLIKGIVDKIKGFFSGMNISFPKIKLPHFSIKPSGWSIGDLFKGSIPTLGIDWYAKGGIMTEPTLFNYNPATGRASVGGEAGDEAIAPIDTLQQYVRTAVQSENAALVQKLERIINLLMQFFPDVLNSLNQTMILDTGVLVAETATAMDMELGKIAIKKGRGR